MSRGQLLTNELTLRFTMKERMWILLGATVKVQARMRFKRWPGPAQVRSADQGTSLTLPKWYIWFLMRVLRRKTIRVKQRLPSKASVPAK